MYTCRACGKYYRKDLRSASDLLCKECDKLYNERMFLDCPVASDGTEFIGPMYYVDWANMKEVQRLVEDGRKSQEAYDREIDAMVYRNNPQKLNAKEELDRKYGKSRKQQTSLPKRTCKQRFVGYDPRERV